MTRTFRIIRSACLALAAAASLFLLAGCDELGTIATPGGTLSVEVRDLDASSLEVVVVFDTDRIIGNGNEEAFAFPLSDYVDDFGGVYHTMSFSCPDVPEGDYFVYAWLDFDADGEFDPGNGESSWLFDASTSSYYIYTEVPPYKIDHSGEYAGDPVPNYFVTDRFAAQLEIFLSAMGAS